MLVSCSTYRTAAVRRVRYRSVTNPTVTYGTASLPSVPRSQSTNEIASCCLLKRPQRSGTPSQIQCAWLDHLSIVRAHRIAAHQHRPLVCDLGPLDGDAIVSVSAWLLALPATTTTGALSIAVGRHHGRVGLTFRIAAAPAIPPSPSAGHLPTGQVHLWRLPEQPPFPANLPPPLPLTGRLRRSLGPPVTGPPSVGLVLTPQLPQERDGQLSANIAGWPSTAAHERHGSAVD